MFGNGNNHKLKIFSGRANRRLAEDIAKVLGVPLGRITLGDFPDGETSVRIDEDVRGRDVFVVQSTCTPVNQSGMCARGSSGSRIIWRSIRSKASNLLRRLMTRPGPRYGDCIWIPAQPRSKSCFNGKSLTGYVLRSNL